MEATKLDFHFINKKVLKELIFKYCNIGSKKNYLKIIFLHIKQTIKIKLPSIKSKKKLLIFE